MTNYEKYKDKIVALDYDIAIDENGKLAHCHYNCELRCEDCGFGNCEGGVSSCRQATVKWLFSEYEEPPINWGKVPVDTPILVKANKIDTWRRRYFAGVREGMVTTYPEGRTSWSNNDTLVSWPIAKLYKEEINENNV